MTRDYIPPPSELPPGSIVWAYLRDSGGPSQELSVIQQTDEVKAYSQRHGLSLGHVVADVAKTGTTEMGREAFGDLIDLTADPDLRPAGLLLWSFARFGRNLDDATYYKAMLRKRGIVVHSLTDPIPEGQYGRVVETIIDISNAEKSRQTSRDVRRALQAMVRQGFAPGGFPPRGYLAEKVTIGHKRDGHPRIVSRWVEDPELWEIAKLAWAMRSEGRSYPEIREVTGRQLYTDISSWTTFFSNKTYLGIGKCGDLEISNHHPAMIDQATWDAVQRVQEATRRKQADRNPRRLGAPTLLSGVSVCVHCGAAICFQCASNRWPYYICGRKLREGKASCEGRAIGARKADAGVLGVVLTRILTSDFADDLLCELRAELADTSAIDREAARLTNDIKASERAIQNLLDLAENFGARAAADRLREREGEQARLQLELQQLEAKRAAAEIEITPDALAVVLAAWQWELTGARNMGDVRALKRLLARFVSKVELGYNVAHVWYTYPLDDLAPIQSGSVWGHQ